MMHKAKARLALRREENRGAGEELRAARLDAGMSMRDLGDRLGVRSTAVANWESGLNKPPPEAKEALLKDGRRCSRG